MKKITVHSLMLLLMSVLVLSSCSKTPKYAKLIPDDAQVLVRFDVKQTIEKSGVSDDKKSIDKLKEMLSEGADAKTAKKIKEIIDDPVKLGLDLRDPLVIYAKNISGISPVVGCVGSIYDKGDFTECMNLLANEAKVDKVKEKKGVSYILLNGAGVFFTNESFLITKADEDNFNNPIDVMNEGEDGSMEGAVKMDMLCNADGIMQVMVNGDLFVQVAESRNMKMNDDLDYSKIDLLMDWTCDKGVSTISCESLTEDKAWLEYMNKGNDISKNIDGDLCKFVPEESAAFLLNMDGEKLWELLEDMDVTKELGDTKKTFRTVVEAIKGDVMMSISNFDGQLPDACFYAKTANKDIVKLLKENLPEGGYDKMGASSYKAQLGAHYDMESGELVPNGYFGFGFEDEVTGISSPDKQLFKECKKPISKSLVSGHKVYAYISSGFVLKMLVLAKDGNVTLSMFFEPITSIVKLFERVEICDESSTKGTIRFTLKDKSVNALQAIIDGCKKAFEKPFSVNYNNSDANDFDDDMAMLDTVEVDDYDDELIEFEE